MKKLHDGFSTCGTPDDQQTLLAMKPKIIPTTLFILRNSYQGFDSGQFYQLYGRWQANKALDHLLSESYKGNQDASLVAIKFTGRRLIRS